MDGVSHGLTRRAGRRAGRERGRRLRCVGGVPGLQQGKAFGRRCGQHHQELVSTQADHGLSRAQRRLEEGGKFDQDRVAAAVALRIIDPFEVVQVKYQARPRSGGHLIEPVQVAAVVALGEWILQRQLAQALLLQAQRGDILGVAEHEGRLPLAVEHIVVGPVAERSIGGDEFDDTASVWLASMRLR